MKYLLLFILVPFYFSLAQDDDPLKFFPHKTGDMWEYYWDDLQFPDTIQNFCTKDSIDSNGNIFLTQDARFINPINPPALLGSNVHYKIDTAYNVYGPPTEYSHGNQVLLYKLNAKQGDQWVMTAGGGHYEMCRVEKVLTGSLLGYPTIFKSYVYYGTSDSTDTTGLARYGDVLAKGFGLYFRGSGDAVGDIYLRGAVINGILYGDTTSVITGINNKQNTVATRFKLNQNYPNPFNPETTIEFELPKESYVNLAVYDVLGRRVAILTEGRLIAGRHHFLWDASAMPSGVYFYRLMTRAGILQKKMLLLR